MKRAFPWVDGRLKGIKVWAKYRSTFRLDGGLPFPLSLFLSSSGYGDVIQKLCKSAGKYDTPVFTLYRVYRHRSRRHNEAILISPGRRTKKDEEGEMIGGNKMRNKFDTNPSPDWLPRGNSVSLCRSFRDIISPICRCCSPYYFHSSAINSRSVDRNSLKCRYIGRLFQPSLASAKFIKWNQWKLLNYYAQHGRRNQKYKKFLNSEIIKK